MANAMARIESDGSADTDPSAHYQQAEAEFKQAWQLTDADGFYQRNLATIRHNLGSLLTSTQPGTDLESARRHLEASVSIRKNLIRQQPAVDDIRQMCQSIDAWLESFGETVPEQIALLNDADIGYQLIQEHGRLSREEKQAWSRVLKARSRIHRANGDQDAAIADRVMSERIAVE